MIKSVKIRQATKEGTVIWNVGGVADLSFPASKTRRGRVQGNGGDICPTLIANNQDLFKLEADEMKKYRIRKLTPRECWRLTGFSDEDFEAAAGVNSNTQLYAQAGNSIVVNVLEAIFGQMVDQGNAAHEGERPAEIEDPPQEEKELMMVAISQEERGDIVERFRESLMDSDKVKLYGSINSGNYMIHIDDAIELLKQCAGA